VMTEGDKIILTPTYYVFKMYQLHQDARLLQAFHEMNNDLNYTVSEKDNNYIVSVCNVNPDKAHELTLTLPKAIGDITYTKCLNPAEMNAHNDLDHPDAVVDKDYADYTVTGNELKMNLDPREIVTMKLPIK